MAVTIRAAGGSIEFIVVGIELSQLINVRMAVPLAVFDLNIVVQIICLTGCAL